MRIIYHVFLFVAISLLSSTGFSSSLDCVQDAPMGWRLHDYYSDGGPQAPPDLGSPRWYLNDVLLTDAFGAMVQNSMRSIGSINEDNGDYDRYFIASFVAEYWVATDSESKPKKIHMYCIQRTYIGLPRQ